MSAPLPVNRVVAGILEDVAKRESTTPFAEIKRLSLTGPEPRNAAAALLRSGCGVIAEIKRHIPISGADLDIPSMSELASAFEEAGVHMVACQTEKLRYRGSLGDMAEARRAVGVPMMCRDIIVDPYQIHEARFYGADIVPLQVELLDQARLVSLLDRIESLGMTALAEVRTPEEADRALEAGFSVIGVNAWSINASAIDREIFGEIVPGLPSEILRIALGGVRTSRDLLDYAGAGADAIIAGQAIMAAEDPAAAARSLVAAGQHPACPTR